MLTDLKKYANFAFAPKLRNFYLKNFFKFNVYEINISSSTCIFLVYCTTLEDNYLIILIRKLDKHICFE